MKIIAYKKYTDSLITRTLVLPLDKNNQPIGTELATLADGTTYVSMPATAKLPAQPSEIKTSVKTVTLTAAQLAEIKAASPHVRLINERVQERIAEGYSIAEEIKILRRQTTDPMLFATYSTYVEQCRAWGKAEKAKLAL